MLSSSFYNFCFKHCIYSVDFTDSMPFAECFFESRTDKVQNTGRSFPHITFHIGLVEPETYCRIFIAVLLGLRRNLPKHTESNFHTRFIKQNYTYNQRSEVRQKRFINHLLVLEKRVSKMTGVKYFSSDNCMFHN
jgi:hypothetical protein